MGVPHEVPEDVIRAKLRVIDPHRDLPLDLVKIGVIVALIVIGIIMRLSPMPARVAGAGPLMLGVVLLVVWGKQASRRAIVRERRLLAAHGLAGFPISGFREWLAAEGPLFEVRYARELDAKVLAQPEITKVDAHTVRVALPPRTFAGVRGGDPDRLRKFLDTFGEGVVGIEMGGTEAARRSPG
ncbi:MAG: hypothetical protein JWO36_6338 [Myxococcales bacterium]|nr:hypothetical protein [Myxococcales bacterium]